MLKLPWNLLICIPIVMIPEYAINEGSAGRVVEETLFPVSNEINNKVYVADIRKGAPSLLSERILNPGDNFTIFCQGTAPLAWEIPFVREKYSNWTEVFYETVKPKEQTLKYASRLSVRNLSFPFVGSYRCLSVEGELSEIYLYTKDHKHLATDEEREDIITNTYADVIIPCRPTSPDVEVKLRMHDYMNISCRSTSADVRVDSSLCSKSLSPSVLNEKGVVYIFNPYLGFWTNDTQEEGLFHYYCSFYYDDRIFSKHVTIDVVTPLPEPIIEENSGGHVVVGENLVLRCKVKGRFMNFKWDIPSSRGSSFRVIEDIYRYEDGLQISKLVVRNVGPEDEGLYVCNIKFPEHYECKNGSIIVKIYKQDECVSISLSERHERYNLNATTLTPFVEWVISVGGHPVPYFNWRDNRNLPLPLEDSSRYYINYGISDITFRIKDITTYDSGCYILEANNSCDSKTLRLCLNVSNDYISVFGVTVQNNNLVDSPANVSCTVAAHPDPNIYWNFKPCQNNTCDFRSIEAIYSQETGSNVTSYAMISSNQSGTILCYANNSVGESEVYKEFFVSDIPNGFDIYIYEGEATYEKDKMIIARGDNATIACGVAHSGYYSDVSWLYNSTQLENSDRYRIIRNDSSLSYKEFLGIIDATSQYNGIYTCVVKNINNKIESRDVEILVKEPYSPKIVATNMGEDCYTELYSGWEFYCNVSGIPKPSIVWLHNERPVTPKTDRIFMSESKEKLIFSTVDPEDEGKYSCLVENRIGKTNASSSLSIKNKQKNPLYIYVTCASLLMILMISVIYIFVKCRRDKELKMQLSLAGLDDFDKGFIERINPELGVNEQAELLPYDRRYEFPMKNLKLGYQLGSGAYGVVMKATAKEIVEGEAFTTVAVKIVKKNTDFISIKALISELKIMVHIGQHLNIVNLLGACTRNVLKKELLVIVEYCRFGNMQSYLSRYRGNFIKSMDHETEISEQSHDSKKSERDSVFMSKSDKQPELGSNHTEDYKESVKPFCTRDLLAWAFQVSRGMEYLTSRRILHGDLAARNILLAVDNIVKICDFGLSRSLYWSINYEKKGDDPLPIKWMAIESIGDRLFSFQSDVWSFGIVLWEFFSLGRTPYPGVEADEQFYEKLLCGYRMEAPEYATKEIYKTMLDCWATIPVDRPSFSKLTDRIGEMLDDTVRAYYVDLNDPYLRMNTERLQNGQSDYLAMMTPQDIENTKSSLSQAPSSGYNCMSTETSYPPSENKIALDRRTANCGKESSELAGTETQVTRL